MTTITLTKGKTAIIDDGDAPLISERRWHLTSNGYAAARSNGKTILMHRVICRPACDQEVDHIDGDKLNNRRENLRIASHSDNMRNRKRHKNNTSGYKGVSQTSSGMWKAEIGVGGRRVYLGSYKTPEDAAMSYATVAIQHYGEFAKTFISKCEN